MADHYTQFSEVIDRLTPEECEWLEEALLGPPENAWDKDGECPVSQSKLDAWCDKFQVSDVEYWPEFEWEIKARDGEHYLWVYSEESGSLEDLGNFIHAFLKKFRPESCFRLTWSGTCSSMRAGAFTGGAIFVTKEGVQYMSAHGWAGDKEQEWEHDHVTRNSRIGLGA